MLKNSILVVAEVKWFVVSAFIVGLILLPVAGAVAEKAGPCTDDVAKFCKDVSPVEGGIAKCLKKHAGELSPGCKEKLTETKKKIKDFSEACESDMSKFCKKMKPGGGRIVRCLQEHESELSPECKAKMSAGK